MPESPKRRHRDTSLALIVGAGIGALATRLRAYWSMRQDLDTIKGTLARSEDASARMARFAAKRTARQTTAAPQQRQTSTNR